MTPGRDVYRSPCNAGGLLTHNRTARQDETPPIGGLRPYCHCALVEAPFGDCPKRRRRRLPPQRRGCTLVRAPTRRGRGASERGLSQAKAGVVCPPQRVDCPLGEKPPDASGAAGALGLHPLGKTTAGGLGIEGLGRDINRVIPSQRAEFAVQ